MRHAKLCFAVLLALTGALAACSGSDDSTGPQTGDPYLFEPLDRSLAVDALASVVLKVSATAGGAAVATFYVDGDSVATGPSYSWLADAVGTHELRARVQDGEAVHEAVWTVLVSDENTAPPPPVVTLAAGRGSEPGSIGLTWERPSVDWHFLEAYRVFYDTVPLGDQDLSGKTFQEVPQDTTVVQQRLLLQGLDERTRYYLQVVAVDVLGRQAAPSPEVSSMSTGHYDITGQVQRLTDPVPGSLGPGVEAFGQVLVQIGDHRALTDAQGRYELRNLPDTLHEPLRLRPTGAIDVNSYYWCETGVRDTVDQVFDTVLFRRTPVQVDDSGSVESIPFLAFFYSLAAKQPGLSGNSILQRWETYPIPVRVDPLILPSGADAGAALQRGIDKWNRAAGETLMVGITGGSPTYGADHEIVDEPPTGGQILGEVRMVEPASAACLFQCIPLRVMVKFNSNNIETVTDRVALHELGHVLWMTHSRSSDHVMDSGETGYSQTEPQWPELRVARLIRHLPNGTDLDWFVEPGSWDD